MRPSFPGRRTVALMFSSKQDAQTEEKNDDH